MKRTTGKKITTIIIIILSVCTATYVYLNKYNSGFFNKSDFEISNVSASFERKLKSTSVSIIDEIREGDNYKPNIVLNIPYLNLNAQIKNLSGEKIENAELQPIIIATFKSGVKTFSLTKIKIVSTEYNTFWNSEEIKEISEKLFLTLSEEFDSNYLEHNPENVELELYLKTENSVGYNKNDLIYKKQIAAWNVN